MFYNNRRSPETKGKNHLFFLFQTAISTMEQEGEISTSLKSFDSSAKLESLRLLCLAVPELGKWENRSQFPWARAPAAGSDSPWTRHSKQSTRLSKKKREPTTVGKPCFLQVVKEKNLLKGDAFERQPKHLFFMPWEVAVL